MRAVQIGQFGIEHVDFAERPDPLPDSGEVLIDTEAATINPGDLELVTGESARRIPAGTAAPYTPGWDLAGRVVAAGGDAEAGLIGTRVVGFTIWFVTGRGTQATLVALPASDVVVAPDGLPSTELTTVIKNGLTAWRGLADLDLAAGETLVVTGGAGGVGGFAVELAAIRGLSVIAVVREGDEDTVLDLGATAAVATPPDGDLAAAISRVTKRGADAVFDTAALGAAALRAARDGGRYETTTKVVPPADRGVTVSHTSARMDRQALATLAAMATRGQLHLPIARIFPAADARKAYELFGGFHGRGRTVLSFD